MYWNDAKIVDISREFLDSNGAEKHITVETAKPQPFAKSVTGTFKQEYTSLAGDLNVCSKRGLSERFDSTIGAGTVMMPFGGRNQITPSQAMVNKISVEKGHTDTCSFMSWGYNPYIAEKSPYHASYLAVVESVSKLIASGADYEDIYLTFQEYFEKPMREPKRWGKPFAALLGALRAQVGIGAAAIGGKDSMSGSFEDMNVPPTLVSFAVTTGSTDQVITPEFKGAGHKVVWLRPMYDSDGLPIIETVRDIYDQINELNKSGKILAAYTPTYGGAAEAVMKMCFGNGIGFAYDRDVTAEDLFGYSYGSFILELAEPTDIGVTLGYTTEEQTITMGGDVLTLSELSDIYERKLEPVYPCNIKSEEKVIPAFEYRTTQWPTPAIKTAKPLALIPVFPGTNCEYDTAKAFNDAGAETEIIVINNLTAASIRESAEYFAKRVGDANIIFVPGGFSGGDEPDGSGKFITAFFRNQAVKDAVHELLKNRDGLMGGICNGFQALIKLGLVPNGEIIDTDENSPTLTFNTIGRHQSKIVRTRIASNKSPWLMETKVGEVYSVPISHGEGRFLADRQTVLKLAENGQIATQYVDLNGTPTNQVQYNPNDSVFAIEGITSPDGRVLGKMGHTERWDKGLYQNVPGEYDMGIFRSAVKYFK
jgi:phosphoribosylformylglycinamidine synthase